MPDPGLFEHVPYPEYASWPAANGSLLEHFRKSAAHAREEMLHPKAPTKALDFGIAVHSAIFEPDKFADLYAVAPECDRRYKEGKAIWAEFEAEHPRATIIKADDGDAIRGIAQSIAAHPMASQLVAAPGLNEVSIRWTHEFNDVPCKGRLDRLAKFAGWSIVVDLKTTEDASPLGFPRAVASYGYHRKAAFYLDGLNTLAPMVRRFFHIAAEKTPPYAVAVYELGESALIQGRAENRVNLDKYKQAMETGEWPAYSTEIEPLDLPNWAQRMEESNV